MPTASSKPLKPRARKLKKDREAGRGSNSKPAKAGSSKSKSAKSKSGKPKSSKPKSSQPKSSKVKSANSPSAKSKSAMQKSANPSSAKSKSANTKSAKPKSASPKSEMWKSSNPKSAESKQGRNEKRPVQKGRRNAAPVAATRNSSRPIDRTVAIETNKSVGRKKSFSAVGVHPELVKVLARNDIYEPFAIQTATLPDAISGRDVLGRAQTGSGKTLAFGLAMLTRLAGQRAKARQPLGLILVPTRELAMQVTDALTGLAHSVDLDVRLIAGGMPYKKQIEALLKGVPILVSTPGRLSDLVDQGHADLSRIQIVVLDEADQMCDMGFMPQMVEILDLVPTRGQRLLFSATLDGDVNRLVSAYLKNPVLHETAEAKATVSTMEHHLLIVDRNEKDAVLNRIAARDGKTIVFVRTQAAADRVSAEMAQVGIPVGALHGGKSQNLRTRTINEFREGVTNVLVATDVAARGIHVDGISLVVHADPPGDPKDYLHRSGRTARAGDAGKVVTLVGARQQKTVLSMMNRVAVTPKVHRVSAESRELVLVTGAKEPSGKPWKLPKTSQPRGQKRTGGRPSGGYNRRKPVNSGARRNSKSS